MPLPDDARRLEQWLNNKRQGKMSYMENHFDLRIDPTKLVPNAKTVICFLYNYHSKEQLSSKFKISQYAFGMDYHQVIKEKLNQLLLRLRTEIGEIQGRGFVDSAPVLERSWAQRSGLGWIGKNGNLINRQQGSFYFIATLIVDIAIEPDVPMAKDYCGTCKACIDECPTDAILPNKEIDGSKCISYHTIELKDALLDKNLTAKFDNWIFGCDVCQEVCPWNRFAKQHNEEQFKPLKGLLQQTDEDWISLTKEKFTYLFKQSAIKRSKYDGLMRNIKSQLH